MAPRIKHYEVCKEINFIHKFDLAVKWVRKTAEPFDAIKHDLYA